jgi:hypothetical protein
MLVLDGGEKIRLTRLYPSNRRLTEPKTGTVAVEKYISLDSASNRNQIFRSSNLSYYRFALCCFILRFPVGEKPMSWLFTEAEFPEN